MKWKPQEGVSFPVGQCLFVGTRVLVNVESVAKVAFTYLARNHAPKSYSVDIHAQQSVQTFVHRAQRSVHTRASMGGVVITAKIHANPVLIDANGDVSMLSVLRHVANLATGRNVTSHAQRN